jgi:hypothetical protein
LPGATGGAELGGADGEIEGVGAGAGVGIGVGGLVGIVEGVGEEAGGVEGVEELLFFEPCISSGIHSTGTTTFITSGGISSYARLTRGGTYGLGNDLYASIYFFGFSGISWGGEEGEATRPGG